MDVETASRKLAGLGNPTRLKVIRLLVRAEPRGLSVGQVQKHLGIPHSTLSHHLSLLMDEGIINQTREGRMLRCRMDMPALKELLGFLTEDCCAGVTLADPE